MKAILISIVIPVYNVERYVKACLDSLLAQDGADIEVIVIDDFSSDRSAQIAGDYEHKFNHFVFIKSPKNEGLGPTRNKGIARASGAYLLMLDSDDWLTDDALTIVRNDLEHSKYDLIQYGCNKVFANRIEENLFVYYGSNRENLEDKQTALLQKPCYVWLKVCKRQLVLDNSLKFENMLYEDIPWSISLVLFAQDILLSERIIYNYRQRDGSILHTQTKRHLEMLKAYDIAFGATIEKITSFKIKAALNQSFIKSAYYLYKERKQRLGKHYYHLFRSLYFKALRTGKVYPTTLKTTAMYLILLANYRGNS